MKDDLDLMQCNDIDNTWLWGTVSLAKQAKTIGLSLEKEVINKESSSYNS